MKEVLPQGRSMFPEISNSVSDHSDPSTKGFKALNTANEAKEISE